MRTQADISRARRSGMTLIEMCIGMVVTSMIVGALSALWFAVAQTWTHGSSSQSVSLTGAQAVGRIESILRQSKYIFQYRTGASGTKAAALIWKGDNWNGVADGAVQVGELALIEHDTVSKRLYLYQAMPATSMDAGMKTRAGLVAIWSDLSNTATVTAFKGYDFVQRTVIAEAVSAAAFNVPTVTTGARQIIEFNLTISRDEGSTLVYSAASLRGPTTKPL